MRPVLLLTFALAACGPSPLGTPGGPPAPPQVRSVVVVPGEAFLAPGDSVQFVAHVDADPGVDRDVVWRSANPRVVAISSTGLAVAPPCGADALVAIDRGLTGDGIAQAEPRSMSNSAAGSRGGRTTPRTGQGFSNCRGTPFEREMVPRESSRMARIA